MRAWMRAASNPDLSHDRLHPEKARLIRKSYRLYSEMQMGKRAQMPAWCPTRVSVQPLRLQLLYSYP